MRGLLLSFLALLGTAQAQTPIRGFRPETVPAQRDLEAKFDLLTNRGNLRSWMQRMAAKPHHDWSGFLLQAARLARVFHQMANALDGAVS